jgi:DNA-binding transcriptional MerR regulator
MILVYGYLSTKSAERIIEANFAEKKARMALEENNATLEIKIAGRIKELKELSENLGQQVEERTKELQEKVEELERINRLAIGREIRMVELKQKLKELEEKPKEK